MATFWWSRVYEGTGVIMRSSAHEKVLTFAMAGFVGGYLWLVLEASPGPISSWSQSFVLVWCCERPFRQVEFHDSGRTVEAGLHCWI